MIQLNITDSKGQRCHLNDLIVVHYTNDRVKFFGVLKFDDGANEFYISDLCDNYENFNKNYKWKKFETLGQINLTPALVNELGRVQVKNKKEFDKIFKLCAGL